MARRPVHPPLNVFLNGRLVGVLRRVSTGAKDFRDAGEWLQWRGTFPVSLSLPLREDRYIGAPVINVFDNLLPDNDAIRKRVAERVGAEGTDAYSMLAPSATTASARCSSFPMASIRALRAAVRVSSLAKMTSLE